MPSLPPVAVVLSSIPSPGSNVLELGPLQIRFYGLCIAAGVIAAVVISQRRWRRWGGDPDDIVTVALWAVPAGLIGARLYHVITDWNRLYSGGRWTNAFRIWEGGLGIPGGVLAGAVVGVLVARRMVPNWRRMADAVAPAIPVAQAIGRLGNWFNQELYGRPTTLPWALQIDPEHRQPARYAKYSTFHPTFLYEGLWNLGLAGLIIWGSARWVFKPGRWFAVYVAGYGLGRLWVESLRIDTATLLGPFRVNTWVSLVLIGGGLLWLLWGGGPLDREATARLRGGESMHDILAAETSFTPSVGGEESVGGEDSVGGEESTTDGVGEGGPAGDGPVAEGAVTNDDQGEAGAGVEPAEGP